LDDPKLTDDQLLDQMMAYPILIDRPIVGASTDRELYDAMDKNHSASRCRHLCSPAPTR
jgi:ArsC family